MAKWLVKTEPAAWSWDDQVRKGVEPWNGVRNAQALLNMRAMRQGEELFFYHSVTGKEIVGICTVARTFYDDPSDPGSGLVDLKAGRALKHPVSLRQIKEDGRFADFALVRQSRLSVMPVSDAHWRIIMEMAGEG